MGFITIDNPVVSRLASAAGLAFLTAACILTAVLPSRTAPLGDPETDVDALALINTGDTAWVLCSAGLVLIMTPGVAFFYGGMVKHKNVVATMLQNFICMGLIAICFTFLGFSIAFGPDAGQPNPSTGNTPGIIGQPRYYAVFQNVGAKPFTDFAPTIPGTVFFAFQLMFAVITPALITGAIAERANFPAYLMFICLWHFLVYCPTAHMVWHPQGLIRAFGVLDFAGGTVVHMTSGYAALVGALFIGKGIDDGLPKEVNSVPNVLLGTSLLWFGWFGFNAGSALGANALAGQAFLTTNACTAVAMIVFMLMDNIRGHKSRVSSACAGAVVGLVVITPACGFVTVGGACCMGVIGGIICNLAFAAFEKMRKYIDDSTDVFPCHGVGGTVGMICTSLFATKDVNPYGNNGLFYGEGGAEHFWKTLVTMIGVIGYVCIVSYLCYAFTNLFITFRATDMEMLLGLDVSKHGERAIGGTTMNDMNASVHGGGFAGGDQIVTVNPTDMKGAL